MRGPDSFDIGNALGSISVYQTLYPGTNKLREILFTEIFEIKLLK